jgi:hypothetical protein
MSHGSLARRAEFFDRTRVGPNLQAIHVVPHLECAPITISCPVRGADAALRPAPLAGRSCASSAFAGESLVCAQDRAKLRGVTALIWMRLERAIVKRASNRRGICARLES